MKDKTSASLEALTGLLAERQRYEEWLSALETRKSSTPDSVYQRVRGDYQGRLQDVSGRLGARAGELKSNIDALSTKLEEIAKDETALLETRQEAEVRAAVGEYTDDEWLRIKSESEKELSRIAQERTAVETQLSELNRVFTLSANPVAVVPPPPKVAPPIVVAPVIPKPATTVEQNGAKRMGTGGWPQRDGDPSASTISVSPGTSNERGTVPKPPERTSFEEYVGAAPKPEPDGESPKAGEAKPVAATAVKPKRAGLPDMRTEQQKTLKCPECGAQNYPTEWYCERCGGELATL